MNLKLIKNLQKVKDEFVNNGYRLSRATVRDFYNVVCCNLEPINVGGLQIIDMTSPS